MQTDGEWWFNICFVAVCVVSFTMCLGNIVSLVAEILLQRRMDLLVQQGITLDMIEEMDIDNSGEVRCITSQHCACHVGQVERIEFLQTMLVKWGRCSMEDIERINEIFDELDRDAGGTLGVNDIRRKSALPPPT